MSTPTPELQLERLLGDYLSRDVTPTDIVGQVIAACAAHADNPIWIHRCEADELLARARALEALDPASLPLYGVPFAVKDNIDVAGVPTTAGCPAFAYTPEHSAPVVERLIEAGAILIGKTNLDQFATGLVGTRSPWGACRNSFDADYISGGSSSGSAVAVALGLVAFALGTDTAGSGRVPAAFNNIVGLKPSLGRISTRGVVPACRTLDCVSVFALTAGDARRVLDVAGARDPDSPWSRTPVEPSPVLTSEFVFAVPDPAQLEFFGNTEYAVAFERACDEFGSLGGKRITFDYGPFEETAALLYGGPWVAERFHAARAVIEDQPGELLPVIRTILEAARNFDAVTTFDAFYKLETLRHRCAELWHNADVMVLPSAPTHPTIAAVEDDPITRNTELGTYTNFVNLLDLCAVAVPAGAIASTGLPFGVTLIAPAGGETRLLELGARFHANAAGQLGATGHRVPRPAPADGPATDRAAAKVRIAVCGAHLSGQPLNHQLTGRGASLVCATVTAPLYRLYALDGGPPHRPGLVRHDFGAPIRVEVWEMPARELGSFVDGIASPLGVGRVELADGSDVLGFLCEGYATRDAIDITEFGDWRTYLEGSAA